MKTKTDGGKPILDYLWNVIDPLLANIGIGKTEFVALLLIVIAIAQSAGWLPDGLAEFIKGHWEEWLAIGTGAGLLGLRHALRKETL
jgi:hypothetical protein